MTEQTPGRVLLRVKREPGTPVQHCAQCAMQPVQKARKPHCDSPSCVWWICPRCDWVNGRGAAINPKTRPKQT